MINTIEKLNYFDMKKIQRSKYLQITNKQIFSKQQMYVQERKLISSNINDTVVSLKNVPVVLKKS